MLIDVYLNCKCIVLSLIQSKYKKKYYTIYKFDFDLIYSYTQPNHIYLLTSPSIRNFSTLKFINIPSKDNIHFHFSSVFFLLKYFCTLYPLKLYTRVCEHLLNTCIHSYRILYNLI